METLTVADRNGGSPVYKIPFPKPRFNVWDFVLTEQVVEGSEGDRPRWYLHTAIICGLQWNPRYGEWEYSLYFPSSPCSWLPDGYFDVCTVVDSALYPMDYKTAG